MKLGKDFLFIAQIIIAVLKAVMSIFAKANDDDSSDGKELLS